MSEKTKELVVQETKTELNMETNEVTIKNLIYVIRGQQVMMDSDLAELYQVETKALNRAVKRNISRFPEDFCFQLSEAEFENLRCQLGTSSLENDNYGGRRYLPYVFTEQGISMLSAVLRSEVAVNVSVRIMRTFVEMRRFMTNNSLVLNKINELEVKQLIYQKDSDGTLAYHVGASLKDAGKKCFAINIIEDRANIIDILNRINKTDNGGTDDGRAWSSRNHQRKDRCAYRCI